MRYKVEIVESLAMTVKIEASSAEDALRQVEEKYYGEEIVVESGKGQGVEFIVSPAEE